MRTNQDLFFETAEAFVALVSEIPRDAFDTPALGVWDVRSLVGHTSRAITTVLDYLADPVDQVEGISAADYLAAGTRMDPSVHQGVAERGVEAGHLMGDEPAEVIENLIGRARDALGALESDPVIRTRLGLMRLSDYLLTRVVELVIHTTDLAAALGLQTALPEQAVSTTLQLVAESAVLSGRGLPAIRQLTGRDGSDFSAL